MPDSGIVCDDAAGKAAAAITGPRSKVSNDTPNGWIILTFTADKKNITVFKTALEENDDKSFEAMKEVLIDNKGLVGYLAIDLPYTTVSGQARIKQAYISFSIDGEAKIKDNICMTTSVDAVKKLFGGIPKTIPIKDWDDMTAAYVIDEISEKRTK